MVKQEGSVAGKSCPKCGVIFSCGAERGRCWCMDLPPLTQLPPYQDCLCLACLRAWHSALAEAAGQVENGVPVAPGEAAPGGLRQF